jgi:hypothetical protein
MREAPLNVGMIIDTDLDSMGYSSFRDQRHRKSLNGYTQKDTEDEKGQWSKLPEF